MDRLKFLNFKVLLTDKRSHSDSGQAGTGLPKRSGVSGELRSQDGGLHAQSSQKSTFLRAFTSLQMDAV